MRYMFILFIAISVITGNYEVCSAASSKITIKVVDEDGQPVEGADVGITFQLPNMNYEFYSVKGLSDASGLFSGSGKKKLF